VTVVVSCDATIISNGVGEMRGAQTPGSYMRASLVDRIVTVFSHLAPSRRHPLLALDQLDDRMKQPIGGRRDAQHFATPHDEAVQMIDLTALAARQILRGR